MYVCSACIKAIFPRKMFGCNITPEAIVAIIMFGARWVVKKIKFTKF